MVIRMKTIKGSTEYKAEEIDYGTKCLDCIFSFGYNLYPEEKTIKYDSNGTGNPGSPAELEIYDVEVEQVLDEEEPIKLTEELKRFMLNWFNENLELIEERVGEQIQDDIDCDLSEKFSRDRKEKYGL